MPQRPMSTLSDEVEVDPPPPQRQLESEPCSLAFFSNTGMAMRTLPGLLCCPDEGDEDRSAIGWVVVDDAVNDGVRKVGSKMSRLAILRVKYFSGHGSVPNQVTTGLLG